MALSLAEQHRKRVERLTQSVKAYALAAGIPEKTASRRVLNSSSELARLEEGGLLSPETLEKREKALAEKRRELKTRSHTVSAA